MPDSELYLVVTAEGWVFITNNERDFRALAALAELHSGLIILPQGLVDQQRRWFDDVITYVEGQAAQDGEPPADWMVCRIVVLDEAGKIGHG